MKESKLEKPRYLLPIGEIGVGLSRGSVAVFLKRSDREEWPQDRGKKGGREV